jgi:hypothetical protein
MQPLDSQTVTNKLFNSYARHSLTSYLFIFMLAILVTACGGGSSAPSEKNTAPVTANAGPIIAARVGETPVLDGSKSYTSTSNTITYNWSFAHKPFGSKATLNGATSANPSFVADTKGVYTVQLVVSANGFTSKRAIQVVIVTNAGESLTGPFNHPGLSSQCVKCHNGVLVNPGKSPDHLATSNMCEACHTPQGSAIIPFADHQEVFGNCSECHDGTKAIGKSTSHIDTQAECDSCHNTTSFLLLSPNGTFDHTGIRKGCIACHNGTIAIGKHKGHTTTNAECSACHTTTNRFKNAYPDHTDPTVIANGCDSCHGVSNGQGGLIAKGPTVGHPIPAAGVDCVACHSTVTFNMGGVFNHRLLDATVQPCSSCHNDNNSVNARGKGSAVNHPATTADCGACHNTQTFANAFNVDHSTLDPNTRCDSCHAADGSGTATGMPLTTPFYQHMPTTEDCKVCHTPGTFTTGTYDHAGVTNGCNACHNNVIGVGKLPNHIVTIPDNQDCSVCHVTTSFADVTFDHASADTSNCVSCHTGNISKGKSPGHVNTSLNCSSCHVINNGYTTFAGTFVHDTNVVGGDCASCHNTGISTPKKVNHIPAQAECSQCHADTTIPGGFASNSFLANVHTSIISGCEGCHVKRIQLPNHPNLVKNSLHLPTSQDCDVCHTNASFAAPTNFVHKGITGNCSSCHNGSFTGVGARGKTATHPATTQDCGICHNSSNFADATFDHTGRVSNCAACHGDGATGAVTKKNSGHIPTTDDCSVCHVPGTFANAVFDHTGRVSNCAQCHGDNATAAVTKKNIGHVPTNQDCSVCHNTTAFAGARFDHLGIVDNCASCHDGATARGKTPPPNHVPTNQDCSVCHQTTGFVPATFDHVGIVNNCESCHDGLFAKGKSKTHITTNQDCSICHSTSAPLSFTGAVFDHTGIVNNCASCHDGNTAKGKSAKTNPAHLATSLDCSACHTTATFVGGTWVHDSSTAGNCDQCHSAGGGATVKSGNHLNTTEQCDVCHTTKGWAPASFTHSRNGNYPGDHRKDPGCTGCHKGSIGGGLTIGNYPNQLKYAPDCAGCHAGKFKSKSDHIGGKNGTVSQNRNCAGSGCHKVSDNKFD